MSPSGLALLAGAVLFLFAGYSTIQHRDSLKLAQQDLLSIPASILSVVALAVALCLWGTYHKAGKLKDISALAGQQGLDASTFRPDFMAFNHRGHAATLQLSPLFAQ